MISTKEDRADGVREEIANLKRDYEEECEWLWKNKYELDYKYLEQKLDDILGII